jgi:hypothetical protein
MNVKILIDSIVRQTTVLIAQLATAGGVRAPLAHVGARGRHHALEKLVHEARHAVPRWRIVPDRNTCRSPRLPMW